MCELDPDAVARVRRDDGIQRAVDHADRVSHAWSVLAYQELVRFLNLNPVCARDGFLAQEYVASARLHKIPEPPDRRAFGAIIQRAARAGLIVKAGYREDKFCSPKTLWRRA